MGVLHISLFGSFRIINDSEPGAVSIPPKAQALLAYLLLHGPRSHPRERLAGLFWGDYSQERARSCLSTTLWRLRCSLEPNQAVRNTYIVTGPDGEIGFNWNSNHWLDVEAFQQQVAAVLTHPSHSVTSADIQTLEEALALYDGELLEGFYDDWVIGEQERLRCLYLDGLELLMRAYRHRAMYDKSLACGRRILDKEPLHEAIHREMMRIYLDTGQRTLAVRQYETCCEVLSRQLQVEPMEETRVLYARARDDEDHSQGRASRNSLQRVLKLLGLAMCGFDEAQRGFEQASQSLQRAQCQLQGAQQLLDSLTDH